MKDFMSNFSNVMSFELINGITVARLISCIILVAACLIVVKILLSVARRTTKRFEADKAVHNFIMLIVKVVLYFVCVLIVGDYIGIPMTSLLAVFSVAGLAVSLSLQDQLANVFGGFIIILNKPFRANDIISVAGETGSVVNITLTYTTLCTPDNATIYIPNKDASTKNIVNYSRLGLRRVTAKFSASYDCSSDEVRKAALAAVDMTANIVKEDGHAPIVGLNNYGSSAIEYVVHVWCNGDKFWDVTYELNENIKKAFDMNKVVMTYDHINVHMIENN